MKWTKSVKKEYARNYRYYYYGENTEAVIKDTTTRNKDVYKFKFQKSYAKRNSFVLGMYNHFVRLSKKG